MKKLIIYPLALLVLLAVTLTVHFVMRPYLREPWSGEAKASTPTEELSALPLAEHIGGTVDELRSALSLSRFDLADGRHSDLNIAGSILTEPVAYGGLNFCRYLSHSADGTIYGTGYTHIGDDPAAVLAAAKALHAELSARYGEPLERPDYIVALTPYIADFLVDPDFSVPGLYETGWLPRDGDTLTLQLFIKQDGTLTLDLYYHRYVF